MHIIFRPLVILTFCILSSFCYSAYSINTIDMHGIWECEANIVFIPELEVPIQIPSQAIPKMMLNFNRGIAHVECNGYITSSNLFITNKTISFILVDVDETPYRVKFFYDYDKENDTLELNSYILEQTQKFHRAGG